MQTEIGNIKSVQQKQAQAYKMKKNIITILKTESGN
jgi:hypothetical protein